MSLSPFAALLICLALAVAGPLAAMRYLRPILMQTIGRLCDDGQGSGPIAADFWTRAAYVLAISGTALLVLLWGDFGPAARAAAGVRRRVCQRGFHCFQCVEARGGPAGRPPLAWGRARARCVLA